MGGIAMAQHLSVRVPWHDHGWDGTICTAPDYNTSCLRLKNIFENKDDTAECAMCGQCMAGNEEGLPCVSEGAAFMSSVPLKKTQIHPYKKNNPDTHGHFLPTEVTFPAYSLPGRPYRWMRKEMVIGNRNTTGLQDIYGINYDNSIEPTFHWMKNNNEGWIQEAANHKAVFDVFYDDVIPDKSLCVIYAKQVPFVEDNRRVILGIGHITNLLPAIEHNHTEDGELRSMTWETMLSHSIRTDNKDGFLIPYQEMMEYAKTHEDFDIFSIAVFNPDDAFGEFSFATEHVSFDSMIDVIQNCIKSMQIVNECLGGYSDVLGWLNARLAEVWKDRGAFPGLGEVLCSLGIPLGVVIAKEIRNIHNDNDMDFWGLVDAIFDNPSEYLSDSLGACISPIIQTAWKKLKPERKSLIKLLSRFSLTLEQAELLYNPSTRVKYDIECSDKDLLENPYLIYEKTRLLHPDLVVSIKRVDRAVFPIKEIADNYPLEEPSKLTSDNDWRRIRALAVRVLETEAEKGNTILPYNMLLDAIHDLIMEPPCTVTNDILQGIESLLRPEIIKREMKNGTEYYKLVRINEFDKMIEKRIGKRIKAPKLSVNADWRKLLDEALAQQGFPNKNLSEDEERARTEKAAVLEELAKSRISVLVGDAGTGKTTVLATLCAEPSIKAGGALLLAPTGKATVRLMESMGELANEFESLNVAQFLARNGGFDWDSMKYRLCRQIKTAIPKTVIIDEASMLTEEMFGALLSGISSAERIILVGDPNQLPPIGAGRPFVDLIGLLKLSLPGVKFPKVCNCYGELTVNRRQQNSETERLDVELSRLFTNTDNPTDENIIAQIKLGQTNNVDFVQWKTREDLEEKIIETLQAEISDGDLNEQEAFDKSLGATFKGDYTYFNRGIAKNAENWQLLAPVRNDAHGVMNINHLLHMRYRENLLEVVKRSRYKKIAKPFGPEGIVYGDKVINVINHRRDAWPEGGRNYIANGEIGIACGAFGKQHDFLNVEFSSQNQYSYSYTAGEFGEDSDIKLELAYALTVHKAQGSQFDTVFLVIAEPCRILSREMLYTALTRQKGKIVILYNKNPLELMKYTSVAYSDIAKRFTDLLADVFADYKPEIVEHDGNFYEERLIHKTAKGEMVRSKSEVIIANALYYNDIPYTYEPDLLVEGRLKKPDFEIKDEDTGITWYWEHCGMMNDPKYKKRWQDKKELYKKNGIEEGKNLIVTEDLDGSIDSDEIQKIIDEYLK